MLMSGNDRVIDGGSITILGLSTSVSFSSSRDATPNNRLPLVLPVPLLPAELRILFRKHPRRLQSRFLEFIGITNILSLPWLRRVWSKLAHCSVWIHNAIGTAIY